MSRDPKDLIRLSEAEAKRLARLYMEAEREILIQVDRAMARGNDLRYLRSMLDNVQAILEDLFTGNRQWCEQAIPRAYIEAARFADEVVGKTGAGFGAIHQQAVKVLADNTFERLESVRQVIGRRSEDLYRQYALEATRQSVIGYKSWQQVARDFRDRLRTEGITGFTDARGRAWNMKSYAEMVARTTTMQAHLEGTANRLVEHGHDLVRVSSHAGSCEKCAPYQGKTLSLTGRDKDDPRCYATLQEAKDNGLFHPRCRHAFSMHIDLDAEIEPLEKELGEETEDGQSRSGVSEKASGGNESEKENNLQQESESSIPVELADAAKQGVSRAMARTVGLGFKTKNEWLLTLDGQSGVEIYRELEGTPSSVSFPPDLVDILKKAKRDSVLPIHNHPGNSSFSNTDLATMARFESVKGIFVAGHDGTKYYVGKTAGGRPTSIQALTAWNDAADLYRDDYQKLVDDGKMTPEQATKEFAHKVMMKAAQELGLEYRRWDTP